jgi:hypothetical protein
MGSNPVLTVHVNTTVVIVVVVAVVVVVVIVFGTFQLCIT